MKVHVNELLTYARLPFHFHEGEMADNPGKCIVSLCAFNLSQHVIVLRKADIEAFAACKTFCTEQESMERLIVNINEQVESACARGGHVLVLQKQLTRLKTLFGKASVLVSWPFPLIVDDGVAMMFQALIDTKTLLEEIEELLPDDVTVA